MLGTSRHGQAPLDCVMCRWLNTSAHDILRESRLHDYLCHFCIYILPQHKADFVSSSRAIYHGSHLLCVWPFKADLKQIFSTTLWRSCLFQAHPGQQKLSNSIVFVSSVQKNSDQPCFPSLFSGFVFIVAGT